MDPSPLKRKLQSCANGPFTVTNWAIGHRGSPLQFPEESREAMMAAARMGAGTLECDVAFTHDQKLVCRHSLCDLHTTTDIVARPELAKKCSTPFKPANGSEPASAECCTSDITLREFESLCAKMDGFNETATTPEDFLSGTPDWRTDLYSTCATPLTLNSYIELVDSLEPRRGFTPELKTPPDNVQMPFQGNFTQQMYAQKMIDAFVEHEIEPRRVWPQSFLQDDIYYWIQNTSFGEQAVLLDERVDTAEGTAEAIAGFDELVADGVNIIAPPIPALLAIGGPNNKTIVPSEYAIKAKAAGLGLMTWSFERSPPLAENGDYYFSSIDKIVNNDGDVYNVLDAMRKIGVLAVFSDWPATAVYFANCFGLQYPRDDEQDDESMTLPHGRS